MLNDYNAPFCATMIDHYESRLQDGRVPQCIRRQFSRLLMMYRHRYQLLTRNNLKIV